MLLYLHHWLKQQDIQDLKRSHFSIHIQFVSMRDSAEQCRPANGKKVSGFNPPTLVIALFSAVYPVHSLNSVPLKKRYSEG